MAFGQQPQGNNAQNNGFNNQYQYNQQYNQYNAQPQYAYAQRYRRSQRAGHLFLRAGRTQFRQQRIHAHDPWFDRHCRGRHHHPNERRVPGTHPNHGHHRHLRPAVIEIVLAIYLGARIHTMKVSTAYVMFYVYAALMGFTLSTIFMAYDLGTIGISLALCAGFFFALTMFGRTTKINMLKAGPILFVGLIVLIIAEVILMIFAPGNTTLMIVSAIGLLLFAGMTVYDAQATRAMLEQYSAQGPEMVKKVSILCALNLYLDFVNMFMYILQLLGNRD